MRRDRSRMVRPLAALASPLLLAACVSLAPGYRQPILPVPDAWPIAATAAATPAAGDIGWREFFVDAKLQQLIALALANNRDLRVAVANMERARAQYHVQRADRLPTIDASGTYARQKSNFDIPGVFSGSAITSNYSVDVGVSAFELDLFSRVRNLSRGAQERFLSQLESRRSVQLALIADVASSYLALATDRQLQKLAEQTLSGQEDAYRLSQQRHDQGSISGLDLAQAQTTVESARADAARYEGNAARDLNALTLLAGAPIDAALLPESNDPVSGIAPLPAQLPSQVLLRRPDVLSAEHSLRASNADIGAARAAFLPRISLTGSVGSASRELSDLFDAGTGVWSFTPRISVPIFQGGRLLGNLGVARAGHDVALAQYEKAIQAGFREVADALVLTGTLSRQRQAQQALAAATARVYELSQERYKAGRDNFLTVLDAQRSSYAAQQALIVVQLSEQANRVTLYKALGGGWLEHSR